MSEIQEENMNGTDLYKQFVAVHQNQLETSAVPLHFWPTIYKKLTDGVSLKFLS